MITSIQGPVLAIATQSVTLNIGGLGIRVLATTAALAQAEVGRILFLHTHFVVRETELTLYGFESQEELRLFELLLGVNKVGPKMALSILSTLSPELIRSAVAQEEAIIFQRVPGIGKKSAEQLILSLRGKLKGDDSSSLGFISDVDGDVIELLTGLGFSIVEAQAALQKLPRTVTNVDERLTLALQQLDSSH